MGLLCKLGKRFFGAFLVPEIEFQSAFQLQIAFLPQNLEIAFVGPDVALIVGSTIVNFLLFHRKEAVFNLAEIQKQQRQGDGQQQKHTQNENESKSLFSPFVGLLRRLLFLGSREFRGVFRTVFGKVLRRIRFLPDLLG